MAPAAPNDRDSSVHWFTDSAGVAWHVREVTRLSTDLRATVSLIFESSMAFRRVNQFPANWRDLSDRELEELSWHR